MKSCPSCAKPADHAGPARDQHGRGAARRIGRRAKTCSSKARKAPSSTSTTAPILSSLRRTRPPAVPAPAAASRLVMINRVVAVAKAYTTRVGSGPSSRRRTMPSATCCTTWAASSVPPRAVPAAAAGWTWCSSAGPCMINGADELAITNLDGLDGLDTIKLCTAYKLRWQGDQPSAEHHRRDRAPANPFTKSIRAGSKISAASAMRMICHRSRSSISPA
jgi:hypothetical protein